MTESTINVFSQITIITRIFHTRCKKILAGRRMVKEDVNDIYGLYYTAGGERIDESTMEVTDENPYYGK